MIMNFPELKSRYVAICGAEPCSENELHNIEKALGLKLPSDFKQVSRFYSGGLLGGISHHEIAASGNASNVVDETLRIRAAIGLERHYVVLAEPSGSIIVLDASAHPAVIWCDAVDAVNINSCKFSTSPDVWENYADFFSYLLEEEEK
jgi:hypothetical protein